jgi:hypothetical protein
MVLRFEYSDIPSPVSTYGYYNSPTAPIKKVRYDGTLMPYFVMKNGGNPSLWQDILEYNQIGSVLDLEEGIMLAVPQNTEAFRKHPEA